jgi:hypothetical protein
LIVVLPVRRHYSMAQRHLFIVYTVRYEVTTVTLQHERLWGSSLDCRTEGWQSEGLDDCDREGACCVHVGSCLCSSLYMDRLCAVDHRRCEGMRSITLALPTSTQGAGPTSSFQRLARAATKMGVQVVIFAWIVSRCASVSASA